MPLLKASCYGKVSLLSYLGGESTHLKFLTFGDRGIQIKRLGAQWGNVSSVPSLPCLSSNKMMEEAIKNKRKQKRSCGTFLEDKGMQ